MAFRKTLQILERIAATPSSKDKAKIIERHATDPFFRSVVLYALNPHWRFKMTEVLPPTTDEDPFGLDVFQNLDCMVEASGLTNSQKQIASNIFHAFGKEGVEVINRILQKDLKCGAGPKTFRKFIPEIPLHEVMKCGFMSNLDKWFKNTPKGRRAWSHKINGVRNWAIVEYKGATPVHLSNDGLEYPNFSVFNEAILEMVEMRPKSERNKYPCIWDGEVISTDAHFNQRISEIRTHNNAHPDKFRFLIFDYVHPEFPLWMRDLIIDRTLGRARPKNIQKVDLIEFAHKEQVEQIFREYVASGGEGLVLKDLDGLYETKRVNHQVKWTPEEFVDVRVVEVLEGKGKLAGRVGRFVIEYEGRICEAGPGKATHKQLKEYWTKPPTMIEVKYREVTPDGALLFPVFNRNREDKRSDI